MKDIHGVNSRHPTHNHTDQARRPGLPGHRGRHLGQFKHKHAKANATTTMNAMPLVQQQLSALNANPTGTTNTASNADAFAHALNANISQALNQNTVGSTGTQSLDMTAQMMIINDLKQTNANIADQMQFLSRFGAISTAF